jgi:hypothetical protein
MQPDFDNFSNADRLLEQLRSGELAQSSRSLTAVAEPGPGQMCSSGMLVDDPSYMDHKGRLMVKMSIVHGEELYTFYAFGNRLFEQMGLTEAEGRRQLCFGRRVAVTANVDVHDIPRVGNVAFLTIVDLSFID